MALPCSLVRGSYGSALFNLIRYNYGFALFTLIRGNYGSVN